MAKLYFNYAAMNAGKSTVLLQSAFNYRERGLHVMVFTASLDDRGGAAMVNSRIGLSEEAHVFDAATDLLAVITSEDAETKLAAVFVDEAQFLTREQVMQLARIVDQHNIPVLCYGLRTDFQAKLFEGAERLLAIADEIRELKTICYCGSKATMNMRVDAGGKPVRDGVSIEIGGNERYIPYCRRHFYERFEAAS